MFEIDENAKYSLRILGRGSLIVVSIALILALIGYFHRDKSDNQNQEIPDELSAQQFIQVAQSPKAERFKGQTINIKGAIDSVTYNNEIGFAYISGESEHVLVFQLEEVPDSDKLSPGQKVIISGDYRNKTEGALQFKNCTVKE